MNVTWHPRSVRQDFGLAPLPADAFLASTDRRPGRADLNPHEVTRAQAGARQRLDFAVVGASGGVAFDRDGADAAAFLGWAGHHFIFSNSGHEMAGRHRMETA